MTTQLSQQNQKTFASKAIKSSSIKLPSWFEFKFGTWIANKLTKFLESQTPPDVRLLEMASVYEQSQCLYVVAKLKVADYLVDAPKNIESLAAELNVQVEPLDRVLRYLHELGIFGQDRFGRYTLNKVSEFLVSNHPQSMQNVVALYNEEPYTAWSHLLHTVKTGENAFTSTYKMSLYEYHEAHPNSADIFNRGMNSISIPLDQAVASDYNFSIYHTLADIGGGQGNLLKQIIQRYPSVQGILFETAAVLIEEVKEEWQYDPLASRIKLQIGDFFNSVPTDVDAYILKGVIHNWPDDKVVQIYKTIYQNMKPETQLLLMEPVILEDDPLRRAKLNLDVNMMVINNSRERTIEQHRRLLEKSGFKITKVVPTRSFISVIVAQRAS
ncbi:MAG: methyltransferase [Nostoc sp. DedVER02]|uniref:methyltransferase n=1 Tax=unclassified Nostoc TaxID=2593658 RepID=UPI002AD326D9|nr:MULTISPECIES: methyltransferase [unclassified Nostoc]MDZ7987700.1 methyltransferase [Nostoc sp. DedVER02]MDZ8113129.1 methyltransferase [Nostoc sp. DedVER01b]